MPLIIRALPVVRLLASAAFLATLLACASTPAEFEDLQPTSGDVVFSLQEGVAIRDGVDAIFLARGDYRIIKQNAQGAMYAAPGYGVIRRSSRGYLGYMGGVWVPRDPNTTAKIFILQGTSERLYSDLATALRKPSEVERMMREQAELDAVNRAPAVSVPDAPKRTWEYRNPAYSPALSLIEAALANQKGKPDVIAEVPRVDLERMIGPSEPARSH